MKSASCLLTLWLGLRSPQRPQTLQGPVGVPSNLKNIYIATEFTHVYIHRDLSGSTHVPVGF